MTTDQWETQWETQGGRCTVAVIENVLAVSATEAVHERVAEFLRKLEDAFKRHTSKQPADPAVQP